MTFLFSNSAFCCRIHFGQPVFDLIIMTTSNTVLLKIHKNHSTFHLLKRFSQRNLPSCRSTKHVSSPQTVDSPGGWPRNRPSMVRQSGNNGMVDTLMAKRGLRILRGIPLCQSFIPRIRHLDTIRDGNLHQST